MDSEITIVQTPDDRISIVSVLFPKIADKESYLVGDTAVVSRSIIQDIVNSWNKSHQSSTLFFNEKGDVFIRTEEPSRK